MTDHGLSTTKYPLTFDEFVGQEQAKRQLITAARSAKIRKAAMDHVLLASGTPGIGKTSLALLTAEELGGSCEVKVVSGKIPPSEARIALSGLSDGDVLIYDEIHMAVQGGKGNAEWLLHLLQDGVIMGPMGPEKQPDITVIGCTTDAGRLPETILQRFPLKPVLVEYSDEEATRIAAFLSHQTFPQEMSLPTIENCSQIAEAASHNPRTMRAILINVRDIALTNELSNFNPSTGAYDLSEALTWLGLSPDGLDDLMRRYLVTLMTDFKGKAGERALADALQEPGGLGQTERVLMRKGYLAKTSSGRDLTGTGIKRAREVIIARDAA